MLFEEINVYYLAFIQCYSEGFVIDFLLVDTWAMEAWPLTFDVFLCLLRYLNYLFQ